MSELLEDLTGNWDSILTNIVKIPEIFLIKGKKYKLKALKMDYIWTTFFGGFNKRDEPFIIDNIKLDFKDKEIPKNCWHIKIVFIEILNAFWNLDEIDESNFNNWRKI